MPEATNAKQKRQKEQTEKASERFSQQVIRIDSQAYEFQDAPNDIVQANLNEQQDKDLETEENAQAEKRVR